LAGILDTDGYWCGKNYTLVMKSEALIDGVIFLARSLGLAAYKKAVQKTCGNNGAVGTYYQISINGALETIPCRLARKKGKPRTQIKDVLITGIKVEPIGLGEYFGFEIDGDRLFMLGDFTVTHNTIVACFMAQQAYAKNKRVIFGVHRRELARQTALTLHRFGIPFSYIMDGMPYDPMATVQIASVATLINRMHLLKCDLFIPDEAHLWAGEKRTLVINQARENAYIVPLTATPRRGNGDGLGDIADIIVPGPSTRWLIDNGRLARYRPYAPKGGVDLSGLHTSNGDYIPSELEERFSRPAVYGDAVGAYRQFAPGKRMIGFCYSRQHGRDMVEAFNKAGIPAAWIDGDTPDAQRKAIIASFADRVIYVLFNCQIAREGFDLSAQVGRDVPIEAVGLYAPCQSLPLAIQMMMRPMRPQENEAILLDHAAIFASHGLPDDDREWTLEGKVKGSKPGEATTPTACCSKCYSIYRAAPACPYCGTPRVVDGRQVAAIEAEMGELDIASLRKFQDDRAKSMAVNAARTVEALADVAVRYGYKVGWLLNKHKSRGNPMFSYGAAMVAYNAAKNRSHVNETEKT
jgi:superfamily II DNA or RNA helicase